MAINFPGTAGQPTDGSYTYTVAGISYSWNGESWRAAGAGASATDRTLFSVTTNAAGSPALSYNNNSGVFSYTPPDLSSYLTAETDTFQSVVTRGNTVTSDVQFGNYSGGGNSPKITYDDSLNMLWFKCPNLVSDSASINLGNGISYNNLEIKTTQTKAQLNVTHADLFLSTQTAGKNIELQYYP